MKGWTVRLTSIREWTVEVEAESIEEAEDRAANLSEDVVGEPFYESWEAICEDEFGNDLEEEEKED